MKKFKTFGIAAICAFAVFQIRPPDKIYKVEMSLQEWVKYSNGLNAIKETIKNSDISSRTTNYINDSLLVPLINTIGEQINRQLTDTTHKK